MLLASLKTFARGPLGLLAGAMSVFLTVISAVQFAAESGSGWMWIAFALFTLLALSFWRFHEMRKALAEQQNQKARADQDRAKARLLEAELTQELHAVAEEAQWLQAILNRDDSREVAVVKLMVPEWKDQCADFLQVVLGSPPLPEGNADVVHKRITELADGLSSKRIRVDQTTLEQAIKTRRENPVTAAMKSSAEAALNAPQ